VLIIDAIARKMEREERLLAMNGGDLAMTLAEAAPAGGMKDVRFLLTSGADAAARDGWALREACRAGRLAVAQALLESGEAFTQVSLLDEGLFRAARGGYSECCELMLDHGADVHYDGDTSLAHSAWLV
jgi:ankyrin repeat protein